MPELDEILTEQAKHLKTLSEFMEKDGDSLTKDQAHEIATIIKKNAECLQELASKV